MIWFLLLVFLASTLGVLACYFVVSDLLHRDEARARERVAEIVREAPGPARPSPALFNSLSEFNLDLSLATLAPPRPPEPAAAPVPEAPAPRPRRRWRAIEPLRQRVRRWLARAGLAWTPEQLAGASALSGLVLSAAGAALQGPLLGVPALLAGAAAPWAWVEWARRARHDRFVGQLPGAFELMARIIRSGQSVPQAFHAVAETCGDPIAGVFARCREQQNLGMAPEVAFREMAEDTSSLEMRIFAMAMLIQRQTGGNLSEVLDRLAGLLRERAKLRGKVRTLTAEGRMQAVVLLLLPAFLFFALRFVNRAYTDTLLEHGWMLGLTGLSMLVGALWIRHIVNFDA